LELRQLEAFVKVTDLKSFSRAAEELHLTQPAVTRQIANLERELRTQILERLGRRVDLTAAGETLYRYASEMIRLAGEADRAVTDVATGAAGRLSIGASGTAATYLLPLLLRRYRERFPNVDLSVTTGISARIVERVVANEADIGVVTGYRETKGLREIPMGAYETVVVAHPDDPLARNFRHREKNGVRVEDLADAPLILMQEGTNLRAYADSLFLSAETEKRVSMELDSAEAIKKMVEARLGVSLLPRIAVSAEAEAGRLVALPLAHLQSPERRIVAIYREDKYLSASLRGFISMLRAKSLPAESETGASSDR
jgi:DNA-binding transcriptional LysR family regulator